jgi:hypothetical protein
MVFSQQIVEPGPSIGRQAGDDLGISIILWSAIGALVEELEFRGKVGHSLLSS